MSLAESGKRATYGILFAIAILALPLTALFALEGIFIWGSWEGKALAIRLISVFSPAAALFCVTIARRKRLEGQFRAPIFLLSIVAVPMITIMWWFIYMFRHSA